MAEPVSPLAVTIPCQLTDEAFNPNRLFEGAYFDILLRLHCLFFDEIALPAVGLVNNPGFFKLIDQGDRQSDRDVAAEIIRDFVRPVLFYDDDKPQESPAGMKEVVQMMLAKGTKAYLLPEQLHKHAEFIDKHICPSMWFDLPEPLFRSAYRDDVIAMVKSVDEHGIDLAGAGCESPARNSLRGFREWLDASSVNDARCTVYFREIERRVGPSFQKSAKLLAASTWVFTMCDDCLRTLSLPQEYVPFASRYHDIRLAAESQDVQGMPLGVGEPDDRPVGLPLHELAKLPLRCVLEIRKVSVAFAQLRASLNSFRTTKRKTSPEAIQHDINKCCEDLLHYERAFRAFLAQSEQDAYDRIIQYIRRREHVGRMKVWRSRAGSGLIPALIALCFPPPVGQYAPVFVAGGLTAFDAYVKRAEAKCDNTSLAVPATNVIKYSVRTGQVQGEQPSSVPSRNPRTREDQEHSP